MAGKPTPCAGAAKTRIVVAVVVGAGSLLLALASGRSAAAQEAPAGAPGMRATALPTVVEVTFRYSDGRTLRIDAAHAPDAVRGVIWGDGLVRSMPPRSKYTYPKALPPWLVFVQSPGSPPGPGCVWIDQTWVCYQPALVKPPPVHLPPPKGVKPGVRK